MNNNKVILLKGDVYFIKNWLELDLLMKANFPIWPNKALSTLPKAPNTK